MAIVACACILALSAGVHAADPPADLAQQILDATGVRGGLVVHLGCGDGTLTAALRANDSYLVHGLDSNAANVQNARDHIRSLGLYGKVAIEHWNAQRLPYRDNLVTLLVVQDQTDIPASELMRVLAPEGVAYIKDGDTWTKRTKPRPDDIDRWTHYLHDPTNNAVADDTVIAPPRSVQWIGSPKWARHHDRMASLTALVSSGDRIFYIFDEGPTAAVMLPPEWTLIARDAFNGTILWKRPLPSWHPHLWPMKSGFAQLPRRLVADGDAVYLPLGYEKSISRLDAATGQVLRTYDGTNAAEEIILSEGVLFVLVNEGETQYTDFAPAHKRQMWNAMRRAANGWPWDEKERSIVAIRADTGKTLWRTRHRVAPLTLAASGDHLFFHNGDGIVCLDREDGGPIWTSEPINVRFPLEAFTGGQRAQEDWKPADVQHAFIPASYGPTLVVYEDVVLFRGGHGIITGLSATTGQKLWTAECLSGGHFSPQDILVVDGLVWTGDISHGGNRGSGLFRALDPHTGDVVREFPCDTDAYFMHHRCYRARAAQNYLLPSRTGIEFVDLNTGHWNINHWVRAGCMYGFMPCNGLLYAPPHSCACYMMSKQNGFNALAPTSDTPEDPRAAQRQRLVRGPAYGEAINPTSTASANQSHDWPTYRHDPQRSGFTESALPVDLKLNWGANLGGKLSTVVIAGGKVFVSQIDQHTLCALDVDSGRIIWTYTAGGRVDSPPTIYKGMVLFGCADGRIYCLRASDGRLVYTFRAAPADRRVVAFEQVESPWPVHGSVLVQDDILYCVAGRSMFLDSGMRLLRLDPMTGRKISETVLDERDPNTGESLQSHIKGQSMPVALPDILSSDGEHIYMRTQQFDMEGVRGQIGLPSANRFQIAAWQGGEGRHLFSPIGFLDGSWWHRAYWVYGTSFAEGAGGYPIAGKFAPAGRILVHDDDNVYGYGRQRHYYTWTTPLEYRLFGAKKKLGTGEVRYARNNPKLTTPASQIIYDWTRNIGIQVRGMVKADQTLFCAGPPDVINEEKAFDYYGQTEMQQKLADQSAALRGEKGALLWAVSAESGDSLVGYELDSPPVWDGMAAADGKLYIATLDGRVLCLGQTGQPLPQRSAAEEEKEGLVAHWKFDEATGETAKDSSGNLNHAQINGAEWVDGNIGTALRFNGECDYVSAEIYTHLTSGEPFTFEAWVKPEGVPPNTFPPGPYAIITRPGRHMHTAYYPNQRFGFQVFPSGDKQIRVYAEPTYEPDQWHHVVGVFDRDAKQVRIHVDGKQSGAVQFPDPLSTYPPPFYVGCGDPNNEKHPHWFKGVIDEVRIYQGALSPDEIAQHYQSEK